MRVTDEMLQVFTDEVERQRSIHGWQLYPKPPVAEWPAEEREAARSALQAAFEAGAKLGHVEDGH